jgi:putative nucleotidyltransferase with HDIG domain
LPDAVEAMLAEEPSVAALMPKLGDRREFLDFFGNLQLARSLANELSTMREERPEVLHHSLAAAFCAAAIARRCGLSQHEVVSATAAGLFHDIGLLRVNPLLLKDQRSIPEHERNFIYAHPLIGYQVLEHDPTWHPLVSRAVLEHHERIDGSGYPRGLAANKLGLLGQLVAVTELAATLLSHGGKLVSRARIEVILSMNEGKLNHEYTGRLLEMFPVSAETEVSPSALSKLIAVLVDLSIILMHWQAAAKHIADSPLAGFVDGRVAQLIHGFARIGIDLDHWSTLNTDATFDAKSFAETEAAAREGVWQLHAIADEVRRHWAHFTTDSEAVAATVQEWLERVDAMPRN